MSIDGQITENISQVIEETNQDICCMKFVEGDGGFRGACIFDENTLSDDAVIDGEIPVNSEDIGFEYDETNDTCMKNSLV